MAQQGAGCFSGFRRKSNNRVEPEGGHASRVEPPQPEAQPQPQPRSQPQPQPQPRRTDDVVTAGVSETVNEETPNRETSNGETSNTNTRARLGEGEGRSNRVSDEEFRERLTNLKPDENTNEKAGQLTTEEVNFHNQGNRKAHRTLDYEIDQLIVRRGQEFDITVKFNRDYNQENDVIVVHFSTGKQPQESKGSLKRLKIGQDELTPTKWGMKLKETSGNTVRLSIMASAKAITGEYEVFIETRSTDSSGETVTSRYQHKEQVYILFNAWCKEDTVYMENEEERKEYVLADFGLIWRSDNRPWKGVPWKFGQFDDVALFSCLWLLNKAELSPSGRSSPIQISRTISAMANSSNQDGGVLRGRWSGDYEGGTNPTSWVGSIEILEQFWKTKDTVKYGQCWVFSGLVTTLMRTLGIPTRSVTNFDSAHDTDMSMTIDFHFDENKDPVDHLNDSIWNFHVWNESWFKRPDLPKGHDGWQAHDSTPQESSGGVYRCGPASLNAIKDGEVYLPYDTGFVFAEVNGDIVYWEVKDDGSMKKTSVQKGYVGSLVATNAVGEKTMQDVTDGYKNPEGSEEERQAVRLAFEFSSREEHDIYEIPQSDDVDFRVEVDNTVFVGKGFDAAVVIENKSEVTREIEVNFTSVMSFYTGVPAKKLKSYKLKFLLNSRAEKRLVLTIEVSDYLDKLNACDSIKLYVDGSVTETGQGFATQKVVKLEKPELELKTSPESELKVGEEVTVTASFKNPLPIPLTKGQFHVEATRTKPKTMVIDCKDPVAVNGEAKMEARFTASSHGGHYIAVSFQSNELSDIHGAYLLTDPGELEWLNNIAV